MGLTQRAIGNAFGLIGLVVLLLVAVGVVGLLRFGGLVVLGGVVWLVCRRAEAGAAPADTPREVAERARLAHFIRFYRDCAVVLVLLGIGGLVAQLAGWLTW